MVAFSLEIIIELQKYNFPKPNKSASITYLYIIYIQSFVYFKFHKNIIFYTSNGYL